MAVISVGIRELKTRLGMYMERVQAGTTVIVTDRGKPVGRIIPIRPSPHTQIQDLVQAGLAGMEWTQAHAACAPCPRTGRTRCCHPAHRGSGMILYLDASALVK